MRATRCGRCPTRISSAWRRRKSSASAFLEAGCPVRDSIRIRVKKAYPAYFGAYAQMDKVRGWLCGIDNLYCIGRNGQHRYNNMDHSMLTALTASQLYRSGSSEKAALWNINTEESYHEDKDEK